jgi:cation diffusion facilitator CzcD-associated flavoprotein CzcO
MLATNNTELDIETAIIGAGFAGLGVAIKMKMSGNDSFTIFERASEVGGTWRDNTYPGCACDIPSLLYSYSFEPNPDWSRSFSGYSEIHRYLKKCVNKYDLESYIRFNTAVKSIKFIEKKGYWSIIDSSGKETKARLVVSASGPLNEAAYPKVNGIENFKGKSFHSLYWDHDYDLKGKKVAVIGTGASAIQFIPQIANDVDQMTVYQRTPAWIVARNDKENTETTKKRFRKFPTYQKFWRELVYWFLEYRGKSNNEKNKIRETRTKEALEHLHNQVSDLELRKKLTPDYELGCKRVLISDDFYPAINRNNVDLITAGVEEVLSDGIRDVNGHVKDFDTIIYGTGFVTAKYSHMFDIQGLKDRKLIEEWNVSGGEAHYGLAVSGFPNLMFMVGPNTGLGHNSIIHMMESQISYILDYLNELRKKEGFTYLNVKPEAQQAYNEEIQDKLKQMVWSEGGCSSYYLQGMDGKNTSIWPGSTMSYRKRTKSIKKEDFEVVSVNESEVVENHVLTDVI